MASRERLTIRVARPGDARAIAGIHVRSWRATYAETLSPDALDGLDVDHRESVWTRRLAAPAPGQVTFVAGLGSFPARRLAGLALTPSIPTRRLAALTLAQGRLVGFLLLGPTPDGDHDPAATGQVLAVHVDPDLTGRGVGAALLARAVAELTRRGYADATLWVVAQNSSARRFYERAGWAPDGASRRERLAVEGEHGDEVTVVRYRLPLPG